MDAIHYSLILTNNGNAKSLLQFKQYETDRTVLHDVISEAVEAPRATRVAYPLSAT
jgi:hypothetical protein